MYKTILKRSFDFLLSLGAIFFFLPLFLIILTYLFISTSGQPFFIQTRPGKGMKLFKVLKFKTMNDKRDANGVLLPDKDRLTRFGKLIRSTSLDELPQLINVIKGDMSLVGPRPLLERYLPLYNEHQARRHDVRPGITGWAQVNGRNSISWEERFALDVYYVDNISLVFDIKILCLTLKSVVRREGINATRTTTMEPFQGTNHFAESCQD